MNKIYPIIMAGGTGSRLWPLSRELYPKQFIRLCGNDSMLQATVKRLEGLDTEPPLLICNEEHRFIAAEQLREINQLSNNIMLEPIGRNTAPAVALAALHLVDKDPNAILLVLAADHVIDNESAFSESINNAYFHAKQGKLVTFGIVPSYAETGYGYIKKGNEVGEGTYAVGDFVEKPDLETAHNYLSSGHYLWNSGLFLFKASSYLDELGKYRPKILECCKRSLIKISTDMDFIRVDKEQFGKCPSESIDYAVMENTTDAVVVPMDAQWSDVGAWSSLWELSTKDSENNAMLGDVIAVHSSNNYIRSENKLIATVGVDNLVIIETKDAVLVANKDKSQDVKYIIDELKSSGRTEHHIHREVYRPWGKYDSIDHGERYQVKCITVKPGEKLSLQMHHHRAEHWIVVSGTAHVTLEEKIHLVTENQSVYIPLGSKHALENRGKIALELIEIQSGSYLGEDDIVRFEDRYGRLES